MPAETCGLQWIALFYVTRADRTQRGRPDRDAPRATASRRSRLSPTSTMRTRPAHRRATGWASAFGFGVGPDRASFVLVREIERQISSDTRQIDALQLHILGRAQCAGRKIQNGFDCPQRPPDRPRAARLRGTAITAIAILSRAANFAAPISIIGTPKRDFCPTLPGSVSNSAAI